MSGSTRDVTLVLGVKANGDLGAPLRGMSKDAQSLDKNVRDTEDSFRKMATGAGRDVRTLDRGVQQLSHGFGGLMANLSMTSGAMSGMGGHMGKMAEHAQHAAGALGTIHSAALLFRGVATLTASAGASLLGFATASTTAAASATALAVANEQGAAAKLADVTATNAQTAALANQAGASQAGRMGGNMRLLAGAGIGGAIGGLGATAAGAGPWGQAAGTVGGAALGGMAMKYAPMAIGAATTAARGASVLKMATNPWVAIPAGIAALVDMAQSRIRTGNWHGDAQLSRHLIPEAVGDAGGWLFRKGDDKVSALSERMAKEREMRSNRESAYDLEAGPRRQYEDRSRELTIGMAGLKDQYRPGTAAATNRQRIRTATDLTDAFQLRGNVGALRDMPGFEAHQEGLRDRISDVSKSSAAARVGAERNATDASTEVTRAAAEVAQRERAIVDFRKLGNRTLGEAIELQQNLVRAQQRLADGEEKQLATAKEVNGVRIQEAQTLSEMWKNESKHYGEIARQERDRQKGLKQELAFSDPRKAAQMVQIGKKLQNMQAGGGGHLTQDEVQIARGSGYLKDLVDKTATQVGGNRLDQAHQALLQFGGSEKLKQADQLQQSAQNIAVAIDNKIQVQLTIDEESLSQKLIDGVVPKVMGLIGGLKGQMDDELTKANANFGANRRAAVGGG